MASIPLFDADDQTDEDFFDKLVNDDDDDEIINGSIKASGIGGEHFVDGDDSEEAKAFAKLSSSQPLDENVALDSMTEYGGYAKGQDLGVGRQYDSVGNEENSLQVSNSFAFDGDLNEAEMLEKLTLNGTGDSEAKTEITGDSEGCSSGGQASSFDSCSFNNGITSNENVILSQVKPNLTRSKSGESAHSAVKEVQWGSFYDSSTRGIDVSEPYSDFFTGLGESASDSWSSESKTTPGNETTNVPALENSSSFVECQGKHEFSMEQSTESQLADNSQSLENIYPGWKYDPYSGQWYQVEGYDGTANGQQSIEAETGSGAGNFGGIAESYWGTSDGKSSHRFSQQTAESIAGTVSHLEATPNQVSEVSNEYPAHMIFDPQYPGWYYDTIAQEWFTLETYHSTVKSAAESSYQQPQNGFASMATHSLWYGHPTYGSVGLGDQNMITSLNDNSQQDIKMLQHEASNENGAVVDSIAVQAMQNSYNSDVHSSRDLGHQNFSTSSFSSREMNFIPDGSYVQQFNSTVKLESNDTFEYQNWHDGNQRDKSYSKQFIPNDHQYVPHVGRSSAGRPLHALVSFGFGGKLIVMKDNSTLGNSSYGTKGVEDRSISVLNLLEITKDKDTASSAGRSSCSYFHSICHRSFPGPLVGGNLGNKELNKWIDEGITNSDSLDVDYRKDRALKLLFSLLKIACQHYGKFRSLGTETALRENDLPESAVADLFTSCNKDGGDFHQYYASTKILMNLPSEEQMQKTASEVQNLLVTGRKKEALQHAEEGQLWAYALILARELGDQFYAGTVKRMAFSQLVGGTPLRTLCLLIARKPEDVFSTNIPGGISSPAYLHASSQPMQVIGYNMLDNWEENLAVMTANRTENDHLVITHLGDSLWKERNDVVAAHICYLIAEADFQAYSDSARLCLIGGDHWNFPRTYASPVAIQRTELFEYSKVIGNSQFVLLPFQPYKLAYAYMLAEVGKVSDALKYCQALYKSLKTGRSPEIEALKQQVASLEDRIRIHQQGGYSVNLAPGKIMGKILNLFDSTTNRVVGGLPPPVPSTTRNSLQSYEQNQTMAPKVSGSQSAMAISSLMPSLSMERLSQQTVDDNRMTIYNRSASEPDIGRTMRQDYVDSSNDATSTTPESKAPVSMGSSRFARFNFGAQILQKTVGLVRRPRNQAKLGDTNKFYFDEKLKTWVEEGAATPAGVAAPPPPPTTTSFQSSAADNISLNAFNDRGSATDTRPDFQGSTSSESSVGFPSIPTSSNQFSSRGRMGVRARYVDTFNKGGGSPSNLFQTPSAPSIKTANVTSANFFIPVATMSHEQATDTVAVSTQEAFESNECPPISMDEPSSQQLTTSSASIPRLRSFDSIPNAETTSNGNGSLSCLSRRTASWSGINYMSSPPEVAKVHTVNPLGMSPFSFMPSNPSSDNLQMNGGSVGDDLHEVEL